MNNEKNCHLTAFASSRMFFPRQWYGKPIERAKQHKIPEIILDKDEFKNTDEH